jgi:general secretion pathway protein E/type IV pilus assembly protein PilB
MTVTSNNQLAGEILQQAGLLSDEAIDIALERARQRNVDLLEILAESGHSKTDLLSILAGHSGMKTIRLSGIEPDPVIAPDVSAETWLRYRVVPLYKENGILTVAFGDPLDIETIDTLRYVFKDPLEVLVAPPEDIDDALARLYREAGDSALSQESPEVSMPTEPQTYISTADNAAESDEPIIRLVNLLILEGFRQHASDIHLEPLNRTFRVRYRIDGVLREVEGPPRRLHPSIINRIKIMARMKISEKRLPQDGRIEIRVMEHDLDLRVSSIPTNHGESIVMRILDKEGLMLGLPNLGFYPDHQQTFERLIRHPDGILLITGPTGSGKTTTLYACLNHLNKPDRKIITVEDPVEYQLSGINQVHVRSDIGLTFATALRSILRQAPNTIMIGEIRDRETAEIAVNAALTGHLVLSTLHTNDAPSAVTRLTDIGVKPFLVSSSVRAIMAQRLVRTICEHCKSPYTPTAGERGLLGAIAAPAALHRGTGCPACNHSGYTGRKGIFELLSVDDDIRQMIYAGVSTAELRSKARALGMRTLREDGLRKVADGLTTLDEVFRVTMKDES